MGMLHASNQGRRAVSRNMPVAAGGQASPLNLPDLEFIGEQARSYGYVSSEQSGPKVRELEICPLLRAARHHV